MKIEKEVDRFLTLLRDKIHERGLRQQDIQEALGWGGSYISQLLTKQKALRVEQVLAILKVIGIDPGAFFADLYAAPRVDGRKGAPEIDRLLTLLRHKIHERGFKQHAIEEALGWGRSYISQLLTRQKSLRVEQVLGILKVIGIAPGAFFADLYAGPRIDVGRQELEDMNELLQGMSDLFIKKGLFTRGELRKYRRRARVSLSLSRHGIRRRAKH